MSRNNQANPWTINETLDKLRENSYEADYQEAMQYRRRLRAGTLRLAECNKDTLLDNFDKLARAATAFRGLAGKRRK
jgi:hypothetical protein